MIDIYFNKLQLMNQIQMHTNEQEFLNSCQKSVAHYLGAIEIKRPLNRGSNGWVFLIETMKQKKQLALKAIQKRKMTLKISPSADQFQHRKYEEQNKKVKEFEEKIKNQIKIHQSLKSKFIVALEHHFKDKDCHFIVMQYCPEGDLSRLFKKDQNLPSIGAAKYYGLEIAKGIQYLHKKNIIHRDLKPQNILLKQNQIKICDFQYSMLLKQQQKVRGTVGTLNYMAPEIISSFYGYKVDVWSFGCILYFLASGQQRFNFKKLGDIPINTSQEHLQSLHYPPNFSRQLVHLLRRIFIADPEDRISIDQAITHPFFTGDVLEEQISYTSISFRNNCQNVQKMKIGKSRRKASDQYNSDKQNNMNLKNQCDSKDQKPKRRMSKQTQMKLLSKKLGNIAINEYVKTIPCGQQENHKNRHQSRPTLPHRMSKTANLLMDRKSDKKIKYHQSQESRPLIKSERCLSPLNTHRMKEVAMDTNRGKVKITENGFIKQSECGIEDGTEVRISHDGMHITIKKGRNKVEFDLPNLPQKYKGLYRFCKQVVKILRNNTPMIKLELNGGRQYKLMWSGRFQSKIGGKNYDYKNLQQIKQDKQAGQDSKHIQKYYYTLLSIAKNQQLID